MARGHLKTTLVKPEVGRVKLCSYQLPSDRAFGAPVMRDEEGAGSILSNWYEGELSQRKKNDRSYLESNRRAIQQHAVTAGDFRAFAQSHLIRKSHSRQSRRQAVPPEDFTFGKVNESNDADMAGLVQCDHTTYDSVRYNYPNMKNMRQKGRLPVPRGTKASRGQDRRYEGTTTSPRKPARANAWKMDRFQTK